MEKIIKRTISLTTKKRDSRNKLFEEFYSHDKNNAIFEFTVEGGVPTEEIVVLFHFKRTNRHLEVRGRVDNDKIIVNFDTSLIIKDEQVAGYIYYENGEKSNDVYRFMFDVHVSEIDKEHDLPIMEQESKRIVPLTDIVTKSEITELLKKIVANEKLYDDAEIRGQIATKADTQSVEAIVQRVQTLENKPDNDTIYNDTELRKAIETKAEKEALLQYLPKSELTPISDKLQSIETNIGRMATQQQLESYVSKEELGNKGYLTSADTHNFALKTEIPVATNLDAINEKIKTLEEKPQVDLSHLATKKEIEDSHYLTREDITGLATNSKVEAVESRVQQLENKPPVDLSNLATKHEIEDVVKTTELTKVTERVQHLEARPQIDASILVTKDELDKKGYLTTAPDLSEYAKKSEIPPQFDSKPLTDRIESLETKAISNGAYNDKPILDKIHEVQESLKGFITQSNRYLTEHQSLTHLVTKDELARMGYINAHQSLDGYVKKSELPPQVDTSTLVSKQELTSMNLVNAEALGTVSKKILEQTTKITALEERAGYEIHGTGMPNGRVTATIGTTYVDTAVTNGALKWIKETGNGDTGWKVLTGDTGWRTLPLVNKRGNAKLQVRRINDQVIVKFDGLQWGWFGVDDISKQGGRIVDKTIDGKKYTWIKLDVGRGNDVLPQGFRSASSLLSGLYGDLGDLLGSVYVGGTADSNAIQLRYAMAKEQITSNILSQIRISPITFITDDDYPTTLP